MIATQAPTALRAVPRLSTDVGATAGRIPTARARRNGDIGRVADAMLVTQQNAPAPASRLEV